MHCVVQHFLARHLFSPQWKTLRNRCLSCSTLQAMFSWPAQTWYQVTVAISGVDHDSFWLSEERFARLRWLLPSDTRGVARVDHRRVISGIVHVVQSGCRWRHAPACCGPCKTLYNRFVRWAHKGVWERIFRTLAESGVATTLMLDATHIKAHRSAAGGKGGPKPRQSDARAAGAPPKFTPPSMNKADLGG